jgi:hypothetical protein
MTGYNSMTLSEFVKYKGGDKIISGIGDCDVIIMDVLNKSVARCYVSRKAKQWSLDDLVKTKFVGGDIQYHVHLNPDDSGQYCIYPMEIAFVI